MSMMPFFLTGANARIILNKRTVAYATDMSFSVAVRHFSPRVCGRYEVEEHQPLTYDIQGRFTVIKYARGLADHFGQNAVQDASNKGNSVGSFDVQGPLGAARAALGIPTDGRLGRSADEAFDPSRFFQSRMFDIEVRQKVGRVPLNDPNAPTETPVIRLRDCRLTAMTFNIEKRSAATQTYSFVARYFDDDTFLARKSGVGQELS